MLKDCWGDDMNEIIIAVIIVAGIGLIAGIGLAVASRLMSVPKDEKAEELLAVLPGANCGACSFSGCAGYAAALATGKVRTNLCSVGGDAVAAEICRILGVEQTASVKRAAVLLCTGDCKATHPKADYVGINTCRAAAQLYSGSGSCRFGCIGFGDCVAACEYDALRVCDGVAVVNPNLCRACGLCVTACPKKLITLTTLDPLPVVRCSNTDSGAATRKVCVNGCIGCRMCAKVCDSGAVSFDGGRALIDKSKCVGCGKCIDACKVGCIIPVVR